MDQYVRTYLYRDVGRLFPGLDLNKFQLFLQLLAGLSGSVLNYADTARALGVSQPTARDYFEIAHGSFIWRKLAAYEKNAIKRVVKHPKGYLRDSGLLHHLSRINDIHSLLGHPLKGRSWEGMVIEEILRQLICLGQSYDYYYYRTAAGAEIDLVLEGDFGLVAFEVKHSQHVSSSDLRPLRDFMSERRARLGVVINNDDKPKRYDYNIIGVPFTYL
jgi:predicted AAA+ superfamily ATPase